MDPDFEQKWSRRCLDEENVLEKGEWGRRIRLFFHEFYGEGFEVLPGCTYTRSKEERGGMPFAGVVWSGVGVLNDTPISATTSSTSSSSEVVYRREFLVTPHRELVVRNTGQTPLLIYTVFPYHPPSE